MRKSQVSKKSDAEFISAVKESHSIAGMLKILELSPSGGNYKTAKRRMKDLGLDTSHFLGQGHLKGKTHNWSPRFSSEEMFKKNSTYKGTTNNVKKRLIEDGHVEKKCYNCGSTEWLGNPIPLELEHINGDNSDNRIKNLTLLCPNCHALTNTYRGRNKKKK